MNEYALILILILIGTLPVNHFVLVKLPDDANRADPRHLEMDLSRG
jgi:hypothetical protein